MPPKPISPKPMAETSGPSLPRCLVGNLAGDMTKWFTNHSSWMTFPKIVELDVYKACRSCFWILLKGNDRGYPLIL